MIQVPEGLGSSPEREMIQIQVPEGLGSGILGSKTKGLSWGGELYQGMKILIRLKDLY